MNINRSFAMVKDGIVENIAMWDGASEWDPGDSYTLVDVASMECEIGWAYVDGIFVEPETE